MSSVHIECVFRCKIGMYTKVGYSRELLEVCEAILERPADVVDGDDVEGFNFYGVPGDWVIHLINGDLYLDRIITTDEDCDVENVDVSYGDLHLFYNQAHTMLDKVGLKFVDYKIKFLRYSTGGCAGISEVA